MKLPLISEVLHLAADKYLAVDHNDEFVKHYDKRGQYWKERFSCCAIGEAINVLTYDLTYNEHKNFEEQVSQGLENMGCVTDSCNQFYHLEDLSGFNVKATKESQEARYFWLKWAALMAEEQENKVLVNQGI